MTPQTNHSTIKYSLIGLVLSIVVFSVAYIAQLSHLALGAYVMMYILLIYAGLSATREIFKTPKAESIPEEESSKIWAVMKTGIILLIIFQFLLWLLGYLGVFDELSNTNRLLSKIIYAALCVGSGISAALVMRSTVMEHFGPKAYAQLDRYVRVAFLLLWFGIGSSMHF